LQGNIGKTEKKGKKNHAAKVNKITKTKRRKYGMNETKVIFVSEQMNISCPFHSNAKMSVLDRRAFKKGDF
jgi:hypothetical protein